MASKHRRARRSPRGDDRTTSHHAQLSKTTASFVRLEPLRVAVERFVWDEALQDPESRMPALPPDGNANLLTFANARSPNEVGGQEDRQTAANPLRDDRDLIVRSGFGRLSRHGLFAHPSHIWIVKRSH